MNTPLLRLIRILLFFAPFLLASPSAFSNTSQSRIDIRTLPGNAAVHHIVSEPGVYFLSEDLEVTKFTGINVQTPGVTIDLNGFEIRRVASSGGHGILISVLADECVVKNGSVSGFAYGVRAFSQRGGYFQLTARNCAYAGLVGGNGWLIANCDADDNPEIGILTGDGSKIVTAPLPAYSSESPPETRTRRSF